MGLAKPFVRMQFKLGTYEARQVMRIERGGIVISSSNSRYQPSDGIRYELSPDEWFLYSYLFFPRNNRKEFYDEEFMTNELYYDYFAELKSYSRVSPTYAIFKNKHNTGYLIRGDSTHYFGLHLNAWGIKNYIDTFKDHRVKPIYYATNVIDAASCMLADLEDFQKIKIDLPSLSKDPEQNPGAVKLHSKLTKLLQDCIHADLYIEK